MPESETGGDTDEKMLPHLYSKDQDNTNDFWTSVISGCKMAAEEYESDLEILAPDKEENIEEQNKLLKKAIEQKPDAILFSPPAWMHQMNF